MGKNSIYGAIVFYIPEKGRRKKKGEIFVEGKYIFMRRGKRKSKRRKYLEKENVFLWRRRKTEKEKEENT